MGKQLTEIVEDRLYYVPLPEFERVRALPVNAVKRAALFANLCRINCLYTIATAGSGHIGSSFSCLDMVSWLLLNELRTSESDPKEEKQGVYFSSKGHTKRNRGQKQQFLKLDEGARPIDSAHNNVFRAA